MKIYRVIDNAECVLVTSNELDALRLLRKLGEKRDNTWEWIDEENLR
jgi:hypothetical protein